MPVPTKMGQVLGQVIVATDEEFRQIRGVVQQGETIAEAHRMVSNEFTPNFAIR